MNQRFLVLAAFIAVGCSSLTQQGSTPRITVESSYQALVGEKLSILVEATDADGDDLTFYIQGRPEAAQFAAVGYGQAVFTWTPEVTDADPGGTEYIVEFVVEDSTGAWDSQEVTITVYPQWAPTFLNPPGYILDLADDSHIEFLVTVKDDAASHVDITMEDSPEGAHIEQSEKKEAYFFWRPTSEQIEEKRFWFVRFLAKGYAPAGPGGGEETLLYELEHDIIIVIINADFEGCSGHPPVIEHTIPGDYHPEQHQESPGGYLIEAFAQDLDSYVDRMQLFWTDQPNTSPTDFHGTVMTPMGENRFTGTIPSVSAGGGRPVYYYLQALDNDDYAGNSCDQTARVPKVGHNTLIVYDDGYAGACYEDPLEPNNSFGEAWIADLGTYETLRLCNDQDDYILYTPESDQIAVTIQGHGNGQDLRLEPLDGFGDVVGSMVSGSGSFSLNRGQMGGDLVVLHIWSYSGLAITYDLTVEAQDSECPEDDLEPNNETTQATGVSEGEFPQLSICVGDVDLFRVDAPASTILRGTASFDNASGDLDVYLLDSDGETILDAAETSSDNESVSFNVIQGGTYFIAVQGYMGATNSYNLTVEFGDLNEECVEDTFAPNQVETEAAIMPPHTYDNLVACPSSDDWFEIGLNGHEDLWVEVQGAAGSLAIEVFGVDVADPLCDEEIVSGGFQLYCAIETAGDYRIRVSNGTPQTAVYTMILTVVDTSGSCPLDRFEPNDAPGAAEAMPHDTLTWLSICGADEDWFRLQGFPGQYLFAGVTYPPEDGPIDVYLYGPDGVSLLATSDSASGVPYIETQLTTSGIYYLMVTGASPMLDVSYSLLTWSQ